MAKGSMMYVQRKGMVSLVVISLASSLLLIGCLCREASQVAAPQPKTVKNITAEIRISAIIRFLAEVVNA